MRRWLLAGLVLSATGCATQASYQRHVDGFIGQDATRLYLGWGAPMRMAPLPGGGLAVSFLSNVLASPGFGWRGCETTFILDQDGIVRLASFHGNNCLL
ncbi:conserved protein of unknown function [Rhodovastum atsumiense]|uniref:Uncharacterized protein n=1 Tax=Rhodovastum atsumiense TaxID=504468 RepID=A0A5M6IP37_9PROT|nr:hypothetical protein [Rhodovastum atsumiense]KAA5610026.1 hypothetical protein F1189_21205 [Rhodovastum atsumiense]CAH2602988.1 conserved protein of unknown function [Rhodovastum atsumiense]